MKRFALVCFLFLVGIIESTSIAENKATEKHEYDSSARSLSDRRLEGLQTLDEIIVTDPDLSTLAVAFETAMLDGVLCTTPGCNFTVFAPTNEAFLDFNQDFLAILLTPSWILHLQNFLAFHVTFPTISGERLLTTDFTDGQNLDMLNNEVVTVNILKRGITLTSPLTEGSDIIEADILASNGALNKVDSILSPGFFGVDVFALGDEYDEFTIFQELIESIGLVGTEGEFTMLAPTNDAFLALGNETLEALKDDKNVLGRILANHVIVGVYPSMFLTDGLVLEAFSGLEITVSITNSTDKPGSQVFMFSDATVLLPDILAVNGITYAIDSVILQLEPESNVPSTLLSDVPSSMPSFVPSDVPSDAPSSIPSGAPSTITSDVPSGAPSQVPSNVPSGVPSEVPSNVPSNTPSEYPSEVPSDSPTSAPSLAPSSTPSASPTAEKKGMMKGEGNKDTKNLRRFR